MRKLVLSLLAFGSLTSAQAVTPQFARNWEKQMSNQITAFQFVRFLYKRNEDERIMIDDCSAFTPKTLDGHEYAVAKFAYHVIGFAGEEVHGMVMDFQCDHINILSATDFEAFVATGDRALLQEPDLGVK